VLSNADLFDMGFSMIVHGHDTADGCVAAHATSILEAIRLDRLDSTKGFMTIEAVPRTCSMWSGGATFKRVRQGILHKDRPPGH